MSNKSINNNLIKWLKQTTGSQTSTIMAVLTVLLSTRIKAATQSGVVTFSAEDKLNGW